VLDRRRAEWRSRSEGVPDGSPPPRPAAASVSASPQSPPARPTRPRVRRAVPAAPRPAAAAAAGTRCVQAGAVSGGLKPVTLAGLETTPQPSNDCPNLSGFGTFSGLPKVRWMTAAVASSMTLVGVRDRLVDAALLWKTGRKEGAFVLVLIALAATSRKRYPHPAHGDRKAFTTYLRDEMRNLTAKVNWIPSEQWRLKFRGVEHDFEHFLYTFLRCELAHQASMPPDLRFGVPPVPVPIFPEGTNLLVDPGLVVAISELIVEAKENDDEFPEPAPHFIDFEI